ncbi:MAG: protein kinase, partial [Planctomycetota bacterium]
MHVLEPGTKIGSLRVERELGRGGFATVHLAWDEDLHRHVALKVVPHEAKFGTDAEQSSRFLDEARVVAALESPHVVTLYRLHEAHAAGLIFEMEFVGGGTLADAIREGALSLEKVDRILRGVLAGLGAAHAQGLLHRDIKPANVLVSQSGEAKLSDFGLARSIADDEEFFDDLHGTPLYMAPEVLVGDSASLQSDLWSIGVVAYQMLTGHRPFPSRDPAIFFGAVHNEEPEPLPPVVPIPLRNFVLACLEKDPRDRPADCAEAAALLDLQPTQVSEPRARIPQREPFFGRIEELNEATATLTRPEGRPLLIVGRAGVGKSALARAFADTARARGYVWIEASLTPMEGPLLTVVEAVREHAVLGDDPATSGFGPDGARLKDILRGGDLPKLESDQQALATLDHLLAGTVRAQPLALFLDDAQHASEEDVRLLSHLARRLGDRPFLLVLATRPDADATRGLESATRLDLAGLDERALFSMLEARLGHTVDGGIAMEIHGSTEGNPLLAEQLARHLWQTNAMEVSGTRMERGPAWSARTLPTSLRDVVMARMAALDDADRSLLDTAAVEGHEFDGRAVAAALDQPLLTVLRRLQSLCHRREIIEPSARGYRFAQRSIAEVLYQEMAPELRREVHRALAVHLEAREEAVDPARLGRHWYRAKERSKAAPHLLHVARDAYNRQELQRAKTYAEQSGLLDEPPSVPLEPYADIARVLASYLVRHGERERADRLYEHLLDDARRRGDDAARRRHESEYGSCLLRAGLSPPGDGQAWLTRAEDEPDDEIRFNCLKIAGDLFKMKGDLDAAEDAYQRQGAIYEETADHWRRGGVIGALASIALRRDNFARARRLYLEAARIHRVNSLSTNAAISSVMAVLASIQLGELDGADAELVSLIRELDLLGMPSIAAQGHLMLAECYLAQGRANEALDALDRAIPRMERLGNTGAAVNVLRVRAELLCMRGELDEAKKTIEKALTKSRSVKDLSQRLLALAAKTLIATARDEDEEAQQALDEFVELNPDGNIYSEGTVMMIAEAVLIGLPAEAMDRVRGTAHAPYEEHLRDAVVLWAQGLPYAAALSKLESCLPGARRASYELLAHWLGMDLAQMTGDGPEMKKRMAAARKAAAGLRHGRAETMLRNRTSRTPEYRRWRHRSAC